MENNLTLNEIGLKYKTDKSSMSHCYLDLYDKYFTEYRDKFINFLEIGVLEGSSINTFHEYFYKAEIYGLDIENKTRFIKERVHLIQGDQSDEFLLNKFDDDFFSIIIDDGCHKMLHQQKSFGILFKKLISGGIYIIEDLHTSFDEYRETILHGKKLFGLENDNRTMDFLMGLKNKNIHNKFLSDEQYQYLLNHIESIEIIETSKKNRHEFSITSIIKKR